MFYKGSRYENVKNSTYKDENGEEYTHKRIRFIKETHPEFEYKVKQNERLDLIANTFYKDSTKFWLLCDANNVMHPEELEFHPKQNISGKEQEEVTEKMIIIPEDIF
jgi:hypothetical protein